MRRADRLFQIVQYLRGERLVTAQQMADRLEVSRRTIYRDVADLIGAGVPVDGEAGVGYLMRGGYDLPPLMFTHDEITALVAGARMVRAWGGVQMAGAAEEALVKIQTALPESLQRHANAVALDSIVPFAVPDELRQTIDRVEKAAAKRVKLDLRYRDRLDQTSQRLIRPLTVLFWGQSWTCAAWCELRGDFRMFRLDRIDEVTESTAFRDEPGKTLRDFYAVEAARECSEFREMRP